MPSASPFLINPIYVKYIYNPAQYIRDYIRCFGAHILVVLDEFWLYREMDDIWRTPRKFHYAVKGAFSLASAAASMPYAICLEVKDRLLEFPREVRAAAAWQAVLVALGSWRTLEDVNMIFSPRLAVSTKVDGRAVQFISTQHVELLLVALQDLPIYWDRRDNGSSLWYASCIAQILILVQRRLASNDAPTYLRQRFCDLLWNSRKTQRDVRQVGRNHRICSIHTVPTILVFESRELYSEAHRTHENSEFVYSMGRLSTYALSCCSSASHNVGSRVPRERRDQPFSACNQTRPSCL